MIVNEFDGRVEELGSVVESIASKAIESGDMEAALQVKVPLSNRVAGSRYEHRNQIDPTI